MVTSVGVFSTLGLACAVMQANAYARCPRQDCRSGWHVMCGSGENGRFCTPSAVVPLRE
ncbi:MAG: hypothetical protein ACI382_06835 [Alloprevotella sp.]